jgi:NAD(P)H-dependent FMN reductase
MKGVNIVAQYKNVLSWLETEYLNPAVKIAKKVVETTETEEPTEYSELKDLECILEKALEYVRRHQK